MRFSLQFDCDSAAFEDDPDGETRRILELVTERAFMSPYGTVLDSNGNTVGSWELS